MILADFNAIGVSEAMAILAQDKHATQMEIVTTIMNRLASLARQHKKKYGGMVVCYEGHRNWRKTIYPLYKKHRKTEKTKSEYDWDMIMDCFGECQRLIDAYLQWPLVAAKYAEADDTITTITLSSTGPILIISRDSDFFSLHDNRVKQYDHVAKKMVGVKGELQAYMHEKFIRGSAKENIANVRMSIDFITEHEGRQLPISKKFLEGDLTEAEKVRYQENKRIMDLYCIPEDVKADIKEHYNQQQNKPRVPIMTMQKNLVKEGYRALARNAQQFVN